MGISTDNEELISPRDLARGYSRFFGMLKRDPKRKFVVMQGSQMRAVILSPQEYEKLVKKK